MRDTPWRLAQQLIRLARCPTMTENRQRPKGRTVGLAKLVGSALTDEAECVTADRWDFPACGEAALEPATGTIWHCSLQHEHEGAHEAQVVVAVSIRAWS